VYTNFWHARWDLFCLSSLSSNHELYTFPKTMWTLRMPSLNFQGKLFDPHLKDQQPLALHLAESWPEAWQKLLLWLPWNNQLGLSLRSLAKSQASTPTCLKESTKSLRILWSKNLLQASRCTPQYVKRWMSFELRRTPSLNLSVKKIMAILAVTPHRHRQDSWSLNWRLNLPILLLCQPWWQRRPTWKNSS